jgi:hypothetical protein
MKSFNAGRFSVARHLTQGQLFMFDSTKPVDFRGVPFPFIGQTIIIPAISYDDGEALAAEIDLCTNPSGVRSAADIMAMSAEDFKVHSDQTRARRRSMKKIIGVAIRRNYPKFSDEELKAFVDFDTAQDAFNAALGYTGGEFLRDGVTPNPAYVKKITDPGELKPAASSGSN